jgi:hypothetical protein
LSIELYVLPSQCEKVSYSQVLGRVGWSIVIRIDPRGRFVKYVLEEDDHEEDQEDAIDHRQVLEENIMKLTI